MPKANDKKVKQSIEEIQRIYDNFVVQLNKLRSNKNKIIKDITLRIDEKKVAKQLKELKDIE